MPLHVISQSGVVGVLLTVRQELRYGAPLEVEDGRPRAGARHGAEDLAWLIGDEAWPVPPWDMEAAVRDAFDPSCGHDLDAYLDYLALYTTFHAVQRLKLIVKEAQKRGWIAKARVRQYDDAGVHPEFAAQICRVGRHFADRNSLTAPIARDFEEAERMFVDLLRDGYARAAQEKTA